MRIDERMVGLSPEEGARVVARGLLSEASEAARRLVAGADAEALHDFRVALRRLRGALRAFRPWLGDSVAPRHEKRLRRLAHSTSAQRDAEVQLTWLGTQRGVLGSDRRRVGFDLLVERLEDRRRAGPGPARLARRCRRIAEKLRRRLGRHDRGDRAEASLGHVLATLAGEQVQALRERMDAIRDAADQEEIHRARIEGKRLRYLLEPLRGHRHADASQAVDHLKRLQDVLGDLHDTHALAAELREVLVDATAERARRVHDALLSAGAEAEVRDRLRASPRPGLLALARRVRERRDALHAELERAWRAGGMDALTAEVRAISASLDSAGEREREPPRAGSPRAAAGVAARRRGRSSRRRRASPG